jgi:hypothetical protein
VENENFYAFLFSVDRLHDMPREQYAIWVDRLARRQGLAATVSVAGGEYEGLDMPPS